MVVLTRRFRDLALLNRIKATEPEAVLPRLTTDGAPLIEFGTAHLVDRIHRVRARGDTGRFDPEPVAELLARVVHSLSLTPCDDLPFAHDEQIRSVVLTVVRGFLSSVEPAS